MSDVEPKNQNAPAREHEPPKGAVSEHRLRLGATELGYRAVAEWLLLRKRDKPIGEMFSVYYAADGDERPVTFVFNGGPGASSAYLHVGALGPKRVEFTKEGDLLPPPVRLADNAESWLAFTDLVFVDPIGTGFSRTIDAPPTKLDDAKAEKDAKQNDEFFKVNRDLDALGEFISKFLSKHKLWSRPVFIAGESYGGYRVARLARKLQENHGVGLNGAIMISPALEFGGLTGSDYDSLLWTGLLPTFAASALYHGRSRAFASGASLEGALAEAEKFAVGDYARYLAAGDAMPAPERRAILERAAALMGLSYDYVERKAGRISYYDFRREFLRDERKIVGLYDAAITAVDPFPDRDTFQGADPTASSIERVFASGVNAHLRQTLNVETDRDYHLIAFDVFNGWKDDPAKHPFDSPSGATDDLRYGFALNPHMKAMISHGIYDMVTPYFASNRLVDHMKLTPEQRANLTIRHFRGGHMFYAWEKSRQEFSSAAREFYRGALK